MARTYRNVKFTYNTTELSIDVPLLSESVLVEDIKTIRQAADGTRYEFITGTKRTYTYSFDLINSDVFDFFDDAHDAHFNDKTVTLQRELDDGTYESYDVIVNRPQYRDYNITDGTDKVYSDFSVELLEI